ncbi:MAG: hypothetical protein QOD29_3428 [Alphaproteobacteria bacterium]|jgi:hypothetical protein|nr:hypothetical protein [Alphaproteobacteria bacterium]
MVVGAKCGRPVHMLVTREGSTPCVAPVTSGFPVPPAAMFQ